MAHFSLKIQSKAIPCLVNRPIGVGNREHYCPTECQRTMRWIEIIALRSAKGNMGAIDTGLLFSIIHNYQTKRLKEVKVYRHATMETDLSVHIHWDSNGVDPMRSKVAQHLIQVLEEYGLINHSVWIEEADK